MYPILFNIVFQLCIRYVEKHGCDPYALSDTSFDARSKYGIIQLLQQAYADDHTLVNRSISGAQRSLDIISHWLEWTNCMKAKPGKCKSVGISRTNVWFRKPTVGDKTYSAFDPELVISGSQISFIAHVPFKFLGRIIFANLSDADQRDKVITQFKADMEKVDTIQLKGIAKVRMYNNYVMSFIT